MKEIFIKGLIEKTAEGGYRVIASTAAIDRQGDSIDQSGWDTGNFMKNPVMLWAHDYSSLPVAKVVALPSDIRGLVADYEFAPAEGNPMAAQLKILVDEGFVNAVSVGFIPKERNGNVITKSELLEISFVPVPANQEALVVARSKGISDEMISKVFTEEKGPVADALSAEEAMEQKWEKLDEVWEVMSAFCDVYLDEATDVESFSALLTEAIGLLQTVAGNDGAEDDVKAALKKSLTEKLDAIKSDIGKGNVRKGVAKLKETFAAVLKDNESIQDGGEQIDAPAPVASDEAEGTVEEVRALLITRSLLREDNTKSFSALTAVNALIKERTAA